MDIENIIKILLEKEYLLKSQNIKPTKIIIDKNNYNKLKNSICYSFENSKNKTIIGYNFLIIESSCDVLTFDFEL